MANTRDLLIRLLGDSSGMKKALGEADDAVGKQETSLKRLAGTIGSAYATTKVIEFGKSSVDAASDVAEAQSKVDVIFGSSAGTIQGWSDTTTQALGLSKLGALDAASTFATFGKSAGLAGEDLSAFGIDMTQVAVDMASFSNTSPEQAIEALGAALRGESEPIRQYGVMLDDATLKAAAMKLGIYDGSGALTAQQKVLAAQAAIMEQTTDAQGDFARTSDGLAGSQKILAAQFADMQAQVGTALLPVMKQLVGVLSGVAEWFSSLDESTQTWIVRIGLLGGGLVLATRAVNGIVGPLKQLGIIGKAADGSTGSLVSKIGSLATAAPLATAALGLAALGAIAYADALNNDAEAAKAAAAEIGGFLSALSLEDFRKKFELWSLEIMAQGKHVSNNFDDMARQNIIAAKALRDSGVVAEKSAEWQEALADAIKLVEAEQKKAAETTEKYTEATAETTAETAKVTPATEDLTSAMRAGADVFKIATDEFKDHTNALKAGGSVFDAVKKATEDQKKAFEDETEALEDEVDAIQDSIEAHLDQINTMRAAADSTFAVQNAVDNYIDFLQGYATAVKEAKGDQEALNAINREAKNAATAVADAVQRNATEQFAANGVMVTAAEKLDLWNESMLAQARLAAPEARAAILAYTAEVNLIPDEALTDIRSLINQGKLDEAEALLAEVSRARDVAVVADAETTLAQTKLNLLERRRDAIVFVDADMTAAEAKLNALKLKFTASGLIGGRAVGGPVAAGGTYLVGEKGPELLQMGSQSGTVIPNSRLAGIGTGGGTTVNEFHFHGPVMGEQDFIRRLEEGRQDMIRRGAVLVPT